MKTSRTALLCLPVLLAGTLLGAPAEAAPPSGATHVGVASGATQSGIDAHLKPAGSISGVITLGGSPLRFVPVGAYAGNQFVTSTGTDSNGRYTISGLAPSSTGYAICSFGSTLTGATGYLGRCYKSANWNGGSIPSGAARVTLTSGQKRVGFNIAMQAAAAIAGKVVSGSGAGLPFATVWARNRNTGATSVAFTNSTGNYTVKGLVGAAKGYTVCVDPAGITLGTGFRPRCFKNTAWNGGGTGFPSGATPVSVALGKVHTGVRVTLPRGGAIAGTITDASNGSPVKFAGVEVFNSSGRGVGFGSTNAKGRYAVKGLPAGTGDRVCVFPDTPTPAVTYHGKCWKNVAWNGGKLPAGTAGVNVAVGSTRAGISFKLGKTVTKLGSIAGTITDRSSTQALQNASVTVFSSGGGFVSGPVMTDASGKYTVGNLRPSATGYIVCAAPPLFSSSPTPPATGWAPRCYKDVAWNGTTPAPTVAPKVPLSAGQAKSGIDIALRVGGEITGTVTAVGTNTPLANVQVSLFTVSGREVDFQVTDGSGGYSFTGVSPVAASSTSGYVVCFDGRNTSDGTTGHLPQCYNNVPWSGN